VGEPQDGGVEGEAAERLDAAGQLGASRGRRTTRVETIAHDGKADMAKMYPDLVRAARS
jgi:hypothetical protein